MKRSGPLKRTPMPAAKARRLGTDAAALAAGKLKKTLQPPKLPPELREPLRSRQRPVTDAERAYWDRLANEIGCIACHLDGKRNTYVSIHHIDGRTKEGCHLLVLPLCAGHHQHGTGNDPSLVAVHPYKARFEKLYAPQRDLLALCNAMLRIEWNKNR